MKIATRIVFYSFISIGFSHLVMALEDGKAARLQELMALELEELGEVEVRLDVVFDVFGALVRNPEVSIATGQKQSASIAPAVTSVITAQDIEAMGARTLEEALRSVPGLQVTFYPHMYLPMYVARGLFSGHNPEMLVMINNVPIKAINTGNAGHAWGGMPVANIARVEVIRGPGSAVYGANAFSGVINIITKTAADVVSNGVGLRLGSYDTYEGWLQYGKRQGDWEVATSFEFLDSNGFDGILESDGQTFLDRQDGTSISNAPGPVHTEKHNYDFSLNLGYQGWHLHTLSQYRELGHGAAGVLPPPEGPIAKGDEHRLIVDLSRQWQINPKWELRGQWSYYRRQFDTGLYMISPPGADKGAYPEGMFMRWTDDQINQQGEVSAFYHGFRGHSLRLGVGYVREDLQHYGWFANVGINAEGNPIPPGSPVLDLTDTVASVFSPTIRDNRFAYLQDSWNFAANWSLTSGIRYDHYSDFGNTVNPRLALVHQFNQQFTGKLLYGSAFRAPSLEELYIKNVPTIRGNPNSQPETIKTWEFAVNYRASDNFNLNTNIFTYRASDKFIRLPQIVDGEHIFVYQNAGEQTGTGLETELRWKFTAKSSLLANYAYVNTEDQDGNPVPGVAHQSAYLRADWLLGSYWFLDTQLNWVADRKRIHNDTRAPISNYTTLDLTLHCKGLTNWPWDFALGIRNLLDAEVRAATEYNPGGSSYFENDIPVAEREWFVEIRYNF